MCIRGVTMASKTSAVVFLGLIVLFLEGTFTDKGPEVVPITLTVENDLSNAETEAYLGSVVEGGVLLGALRRLQETHKDFKFTVKEDPNFGLFLESVNGIAGDEKSYWEILTEGSGGFIRLDVGVGCYKPKAFEHIILRFNKSYSK